MSRSRSPQAGPPLAPEEVDAVVWPALVVPLPEEVNPHIGAVGDGREWAEGMGLLPSERAVERFVRLQAARLAARCYPRAGPAELELLVDWSIWLFMLDDQADETAWGTDYERWRELVAPCFEVLGHGKAAVRGAPPLARGLHDLVWRSGVGMSNRWRQRLRRHVMSYMDTYEEAATIRRRGEPPSMTSFTAHRRRSGAMEIVFDLAELVEHTEIPADWYTSPELQGAWHTANDVVCWTNDLCSLRKEVAFGELHNVVLVIRHATGCSLQEAVDRAAEMVHAGVDAFLAVCRLLDHLVAVSGLSADVAGGIRGCLAIYGSWIRGNLDWSRETGRYTHEPPAAAGTPPHRLDPLLGP